MLSPHGNEKTNARDNDTRPSESHDRADINYEAEHTWHLGDIKIIFEDKNRPKQAGRQMKVRFAEIRKIPNESQFSCPPVYKQ